MNLEKKQKKLAELKAQFQIKVTKNLRAEIAKLEKEINNELHG